MSGDELTFQGVIMEAHRGDTYRIECTTGSLRRIVLAKRSGRLTKHHIRLLPGNRVEVAVSPYDTTRGRVTKRL